MMHTRSVSEKMYALSGVVLGGLLVVALVGILLSSLGYGIVWTN